METFHALHDGRGEDQERNKTKLGGRIRADTGTGWAKKAGSSNNDNNNNHHHHHHINGDDDGDRRSAGKIDAFVVPRPSKYVPDWAAFGPADKEDGASASQGVEVGFRERASVAHALHDLPCSHVYRCWRAVCPCTSHLYVV